MHLNIVSQALLSCSGSNPFMIIIPEENMSNDSREETYYESIIMIVIMER